MHSGYVFSLFLFLIFMYASKVKVRKNARVMPSSDHHVFIPCTLSLLQPFFCNLHAYVAGESRTFNLKLGCTKDLYWAYY